MVTCLSGSSGNPSFSSPPEQPDHDERAAGSQGPEGEGGRALGPDEVDGRRHPAAGAPPDLLDRIGRRRVERFDRAARAGYLQPRRIDVRAEHRRIHYGRRQPQRGHPDPAQPDDQQPPGRDAGARGLAERAVRREAGAGVRRSQRLGQRRVLEQTARMRQQHVVCETPGAPDAHRPAYRAEVLVAGLAPRAGPAPEPWIDHAPVALRDAGRRGTDRNHLAGDLMAQRVRQVAALLEIETLAVAQVERSLPEMHVAVANAARADPQENLLAPRLRQRGLRPQQRSAVRRHLVALHGSRLGLPVPRIFGLDS